MIAFLSGIWGKIAAGGLVLLAALAFIAKILSGARQAGYDKKEAENAKARDENLKRIQAAKDAGRAARDDPGVVPDPFDRDVKR